MVIGLIAKHGIDAMTIAYKVKEGLDATAAIPADVAKSIAMAAAGAPSALAIFNALARIVIGPLADKIGTKKIFVILVLRFRLLPCCYFSRQERPPRCWPLSPV